MLSQDNQKREGGPEGSEGDTDLLYLVTVRLRYAQGCRQGLTPPAQDTEKKGQVGEVGSRPLCGTSVAAREF